jgi:heptosyltransferase-1
MRAKGGAVRQGESRSVLVLKPSSLGDIVHTLPAVAWMKARRPEWRFSWLVNTEWRPLLEGNPALEEIIEFPRREFRGVVGGTRRLLPWLRHHVANRKPDLALDFQGLLRTALIGRLSGAGDFRGLADAREGARWFYDRAAPTPPGAPHAVERYLALAADALGEEPGRTPDALRFPLPDGEPPEGMKDLLQEWGAYVLLHPFSRGQGKSLTVEQVHGLCRRLAPRRVVLAGRTAGVDFTAPPGCCNLLDRTSLGQLLWLIRRAGFVISVDSGPMHLAAALDKPLVGIHTWSDPRRVGPHRADAWVWKSGRLVRVKDFAGMDAAFFEAAPPPMADADLDAIGAAALAQMGGE